MGYLELYHPKILEYFRDPMSMVAEISEFYNIQRTKVYECLDLSTQFSFLPLKEAQLWQ